MASESKKTVVIAVAANLTLAIAKLGAGLLSGSKALLAEARTPSPTRRIRCSCWCP